VRLQVVDPWSGNWSSSWGSDYTGMTIYGMGVADQPRKVVAYNVAQPWSPARGTLNGKRITLFFEGFGGLLSGTPADMPAACTAL